jgi:hypothetical protein
MTDEINQASGITNAPLEKEEDEQAKVPARGESIIGKGQNRKPPRLRNGASNCQKATTRVFD